MKTFWCFLFLLGLDIASKWFAIEGIAPMAPKFFGYPFGGISIFDFGGISFSLNLVFNTGAAWGMFQGYSGLLFGIRLVIIAGLIAYLLFFNREKHTRLPLWLVVTGAIGNGIDYFLYGQVVDFFHFCFWGNSFPVFNLADSYITLGVLALFWVSRASQQRAIAP